MSNEPHSPSPDFLSPRKLCRGSSSSFIFATSESTPAEGSPDSVNVSPALLENIPGSEKEMATLLVQAHTNTMRLQHAVKRLEVCYLSINPLQF